MVPVGVKLWRYVISAILTLPLLLIIVLRVTLGGDLTEPVASEAAVIASYIGDVSFALTGSLAAGRAGMDTLGCVVVGFCTAMGGGTFRDIMLGRFPIWWMVDWDETVLVITVALLAFFLWKPASRRWGLTLEDEWLFWTDTVGLAVFAATGARTGNSVVSADGTTINFGACAACGMFSATFGGLARDILITRPPRILNSALELYALPALAGGAATTAALRTSLLNEVEAILVGFVVTLYIRVIAMNYGLRLPSLPTDPVELHSLTDSHLGEHAEVNQDIPHVVSSARQTQHVKVQGELYV